MWWTRVTRGVRSHSGVRNVMPFTTSMTTSASGTSRRHWRRIVRGNTVDRPPARYIVRAPWRSTGAAPGYEHATTDTRCPHAIQRDTCPNRLVPVPPPCGWVQSRSDRIRMWSGRSSGISATVEATPDQRTQHAEAVGRRQLLAGVARTRLVVHRNLEDLLAALEQTGGDLRLDVEAARLQRKRAEDLRADHLVARHEVAKVDVEEDVGRESDALVAHHVHERMARVVVEGAHAEDGVREPLAERREKAAEVVGVVLEVGVHDRGELAPGLLERRPHGRSLAHVLLVLEEADALRPLAPEEQIASPVGRSVVDDDQLEIGIDVGLEHVRDRALSRRDLVVDRHQDRQLGRLGHRLNP